MRSTVIAYIGLGSNLEQPLEQIKTALQELHALPDTSLVGQSSLYRSAPIGPAGQPDYINAVARVSTQLSALELLDALQTLEQAHDRVRKERWGPRTLDLDILMYARQVIDTPRLQVPHVQIPQRGFVLLPWAELEPELNIPGMGKVKALASQIDSSDLVRLND